MEVTHLTWRSCTPLKVRLITDKETNKPRGYAFIEYMHTRDMKTAYKQADGRKLDNRRVLVDVERGRTVPNWRPRRLGGGLGSTRIGGEDLNQKNSGREQLQVASGGQCRSEEPRVREDRHLDRDREKSRERGRERERERERSHDKLRDRDAREDRYHHHRDRDRTRDKDRERERDRGRDRDSRHGRDRERDRGREHERDRGREHDRPRDRDRDRGRDYDRASHERDRGHMHERDNDYEQIEPMHGRERSVDRDLEPGEHEYGREWHDEPAKHGHGREHDYDHNEKPYDPLQPHGPGESERDRQRVKRHGPEYYDDDHYGKLQGGYRGQYDREDPEPREEGEAVAEHEYGYQRSERSMSREYAR